MTSKVFMLSPTEVAGQRRQPDQSQVLYRYASGKRDVPAPGTLCFLHNHAEPVRDVAVDGTIGSADWPQTKVVSPSRAVGGFRRVTISSWVSNRKRRLVCSPSDSQSLRSLCRRAGCPNRHGPFAASSSGQTCSPGSSNVFRRDAAQLGLLLVDRKFQPLHHFPHGSGGLGGPYRDSRSRSHRHS